MNFNPVDDDNLVDMGVRALIDGDFADQLTDAVANSSVPTLQDAFDALKNYPAKNNTQVRGIDFVKSIIENQLYLIGAIKQPIIPILLPEIDFGDLSHVISSYNNFSMDGIDGFQLSYKTTGLGPNGGFLPTQVELEVEYYNSVPRHSAGLMRITSNPLNNGSVAKWEGTLQQFVDAGGIVRHTLDHSIIYPFTPASSTIAKNTGKVNQAIAPSVPCTCGAIYFGAADFGPGHNSTCKRFKK